MALPITGPINSNVNLPFGSKLRSKYTQAKPIDRPLAYSMDEYFGIQQHTAWTISGSSSSSTTKNISFGITGQPKFSSARANAFNQAYNRLKDKSGPSSGWLENIATINKTRMLAVESAVRVASVVGSIRKGRFDEAAIACGLIRSPKGVSRRKHVSQNFLAFEYGVKPLISDLQDSMKLLVSDPGRQLIKAQGVSYLDFNDFSRVKTTNFFSTYSDHWDGTVSVRLQAWLRITNPDLFLASKLGLIDLALPWKLIPFSFIVDWFVNVEDVISSLTDWYGCALEQPFTSELARGQRTYTAFTEQYYPSGQTEGSRTVIRQTQVRLLRTLGISGPTLQVKPFKGFSLERGAQAIALVLSVFGK